MTIQTLDCVCGGNAARPNHDCERCQLLAEVERRNAELAEATKEKPDEENMQMTNDWITGDELADIVSDAELPVDDAEHRLLIRYTALRKTEDGYAAYLRVGVQAFCITPVPYQDRCDAAWHCWQMAVALRRVIDGERKPQIENLAGIDITGGELPKDYIRKMRD